MCVGSPSAASIVTSAYGPSGTGGPGGSTARDVADGRTGGWRGLRRLSGRGEQMLANVTAATVRARRIGMLR